jgi:predicted nucleotidyltransferase
MLEQSSVRGIPIQTLLELEAASEDSNQVIYLSGSIVEGFANSSSDIDIFVISDRSPVGGSIIRKKHFAISIYYIEAQRIDFEYWAPKHIMDIANRLRLTDVGREFVAEKLDLVEELFIHRLSIAVPLCNAEGLASWQSRFDFDKFRAYMVQQSIHRIDGALEDLSGMLDDADLETALFRARHVVELTVDAYCHHAGNTNGLPKWRSRILSNLPDTALTADVKNTFWRLQFPDGLALQQKPEACRVYVEACIAFANRIVSWIQG